MLVTMLKSMLHEYAQRRHSSDDVHGPAALLRAAVAADRGDGPTTPRRYSEDAQHWIGNVTPSLSCTALLVNASQAATATRMGLCFFFIAATHIGFFRCAVVVLFLFQLSIKEKKWACHASRGYTLPTPPLSSAYGLLDVCHALKAYQPRLPMTSQANELSDFRC